MEELFIASIDINGKNIPYQVVFDHEQYQFQPAEAGSQLQSFFLVRSEDEWKDPSGLPAQIKQQAIEALESYLLRQH
jgi:hypothetical protein